MSYYQNTKKDFWNSLDSNVASIVCPCCGSKMSLQYSASYRLKFTEKASQILNDQLSKYRQTIFTVEKVLQRFKSPAFSNSAKSSSYIYNEAILSFEGLYGTDAAIFFRSYVKDFDIEHFDDIARKFPLIKDLENIETKKKLSSQQLLQFFQPPHISCALIDLTFDQPIIEHLLTKDIIPLDLLKLLQNNNASNSNDKLKYTYTKIQKQFPCIIKYCQLISKGETENELDSLLRILAILTVYFGDSDGEKGSSISIPRFTFGAYSQFRNWSSLEKCLSSYFYINSLQGVFPDFCEYMQSKKIEKDKALSEDKAHENKFVLGSMNNVENFNLLKDNVPDFEKVLFYTVDFACTGTPVSIPEKATISIRQNNARLDILVKDQIKNTIEEEVCGWTPKEQCTESLLLMGGTASGKTTLLQSTIVQVKRA